MKQVQILGQAMRAGGAFAILAFVAFAAWQLTWSDDPQWLPGTGIRVAAGSSIIVGNAAHSSGAKPAANARAIVGPSVVTVQRDEGGLFQYLVNGDPQVFIGMGYNPIYRHLSDVERAANYERDFRILCEAGVNHLVGWDFDKGYEQDKFDEVTLDYAFKYGLGVIMAFYLPPEGNYEDEAFLESLLDEAAVKIARFRDHPALRMWGVGNEVLLDNRSRRSWATFGPFYLQLADLFHGLDPNHPVIYREAEGYLLPAMVNVSLKDIDERPWLLYGVNIYSLALDDFLETWPDYEFERPLLVSEFGAEGHWAGGRALGYLNMWRSIRDHSDYVLGGAAYAWTTEGPEPTDKKWGLMDAESRPVDDTFELLASEWSSDNSGLRECR